MSRFPLPVAPTSLSSDVISAFQYYEDHPVAFAEEVLGVSLDPWQVQAFENLVEHHFLAIRSGSGVGKTFFLGVAIAWFISTKPKCRIPATAPSQHQLYDLLWSELFNRISESPFLQSILTWTQTRLVVKGYEAIWYAVARTAQVSPSGEVAEGLQGFHAQDNLLFVIDETSGVPDAIFPAYEGALTGPNAYSILTGNPTRNFGYFFDIFNNPKIGKLYAKMHVSCLDCPRVDTRYVDMMRERYGEKHPIYLIKVLGEFPLGGINVLIPYAFIEEALQNKKETQLSPTLEHQIGLDVGRTHASSVLVVRQGFNILEVAEKHKPGKVTDTEEVCQWASEFIATYDPSYVKVDAIYNPGVFDTLKRMWGNRIVAVIGGQRSNQPERFVNLRAEGYWDLRELIPRLYCEEWPVRLVRELADIRLKDNMRKDIIQIESKRDMANRAMSSPDFADALMYAYLSPESCLGEMIAQPFSFAELVDIINMSQNKEGSYWAPDRQEALTGSRWRSLNG